MLIICIFYNNTVPKHKIHRYIDRFFLGKEFPHVHRWIDEPYKYLGRKHRILRHTPQEVILKFGFSDEALSGLLHILADKKSKEITKIVKLFEEIERMFNLLFK
jgi:hypothetical protein